VQSLYKRETNFSRGKKRGDSFPKKNRRKKEESDSTEAPGTPYNFLFLGGREGSLRIVGRLIVSRRGERCIAT